MPLSVPPRERKVLCRERNRGNLHVKDSRYPPKWNAGKQRTAANRTYLRSAITIKMGRVFTIHAHFCAKRIDTPLHAVQPRSSLALRALSYFYLMISALCHFDLAPCALPSCTLSIFEFRFPNYTSACFYCVLYAFRTPDSTDAHRFKMRLRELVTLCALYLIRANTGVLEKLQ